MNLSKRNITMCFILSTTLSLISCGKDSSSNGSNGGPSNKGLEIGFEAFQEEVENNALILDKAELGMKRLVITKGTIMGGDINCSFTITSEEELIGKNSDGTANISTKTTNKLERGSQKCLEKDYIIGSKIINSRVFLEGLDKAPSLNKMFGDKSLFNFVFEKRKDLKYNIKLSGDESGLVINQVYDLKVPLFLNPIEVDQSFIGEGFKIEFKTRTTEIR